MFRAFFCLVVFTGLSTIRSSNAGAETVAKTSRTSSPAIVSESLYAAFHHATIALRSFLHHRYDRLTKGEVDSWDLVQLMAICGIIQAARIWRRQSLATTGNEEKPSSKSRVQDSSKGGSMLRPFAPRSLDATATDPGLLKKHSTLESYSTSYATYPSIRTFYRPHPQADKLPTKPTPLPLLVFIHGLGGSVAQFNPLLTSLVNVGPCLSIDLPGCGRSVFAPSSWHAYFPNALAELICEAISNRLDQELGQGVILIGHSMGCSLAVIVAKTLRNVETLALIGICPRATRPSEKEISTFTKILSVPTPIFDLWRMWDRRGGPYSASVTRYVGKEAEIELRKLQERFNAQSRTEVWRRMAWGALPSRKATEDFRRGLPTLESWSTLNIPIYLVGGESDSVTKPDEVFKIVRALGTADPVNIIQTGVRKNTDASSKPGPADQKRDSIVPKTESSESSDCLQSPATSFNISHKRKVIKSTILPCPASHALLYDPGQFRTLSGLIQTFLASHVDTRLSLGWQLQYLSTEGKWDVKNLAKWQAIKPVSEPISNIFCALKTLREIDESHCPNLFVKQWKEKVGAVIDISHDSPVYDPRSLDEGGIEYHKFPTVSKIPPTSEEVQDFINLVDRLRSQPINNQKGSSLIGVHCHYGFNRTGFFICCYLVEREGYKLQRAIDEFAEARPPGIRHAHFLDQLFVRYCVGLKRAPTM